MTHGFTRPWAAAYLHRAIQLARDESALPEQADHSVAAVTRLLTGAIDPADARAGAETAPGDVRTLPNGAKEWVLLSAPNYRNASAAVNAQSPIAERRNLIEELHRLVVMSQRDTGAAALVKRMSDNWRVPLPIASNAPAEPNAPVDTAQQDCVPAESLPVGTVPPVAVVTDVVTDLVTDEVPRMPSDLPSKMPSEMPSEMMSEMVPAPLDGTLPIPDPAWLAVIAAHKPGRTVKEAFKRPGTEEHLRRETWRRIAEWITRLTATVMGPSWYAKPHFNWNNSGHLNGYYWARIYPTIGGFGSLFNVGIQISHRVWCAHELDDSLEPVGNAPLLALWVTTDDNAVKRLEKADPERLARYRRIYRTEMNRAFREWPELWLEGGALVRWHRQHRGTSSISRLVPATVYRADVQAGRIRPEDCNPDIWSPMLPLAEAIADPGRASHFIARYLPPFGAILQSTYDQMAATDQPVPSSRF